MNCSCWGSLRTSETTAILGWIPQKGNACAVLIFMLLCFQLYNHSASAFVFISVENCHFALRCIYSCGFGLVLPNVILIDCTVSFPILPVKVFLGSTPIEMSLFQWAGDKKLCFTRPVGSYTTSNWLVIGNRLIQSQGLILPQNTLLHVMLKP